MNHGASNPPREASAWRAIEGDISEFNRRLSAWSDFTANMIRARAERYRQRRVKECDRGTRT